MKCFMCKSLSKNLSDRDIENGYYPSISFISFYSIVEMVAKQSHNKEAIGYRVSEQGVEILYK